MQGIGREIGKQMAKFVLVLIALSFVLGGAAVYFIPKLWGILKPYIHAITA